MIWGFIQNRDRTGGAARRESFLATAAVSAGRLRRSANGLARYAAHPLEPVQLAALLRRRRSRRGRGLLSLGVPLLTSRSTCSGPRYPPFGAGVRIAGSGLPSSAWRAARGGARSSAGSAPAFPHLPASSDLQRPGGTCPAGPELLLSRHLARFPAHGARRRDGPDRGVQAVVGSGRETGGHRLRDPDPLPSRSGRSWAPPIPGTIMASRGRLGVPRAKARGRRRATATAHQLASASHAVAQGIVQRQQGTSGHQGGHQRRASPRSPAALRPPSWWGRLVGSVAALVPSSSSSRPPRRRRPSGGGDHARAGCGRLSP